MIFDLDGTILNTLEDLADAVDHALMKNGLPCRSLEEVRRFVGNGVEKLIRRAVQPDTSEEIIIQVLDDFRKYYNEHSNEKTGPYPGILQLMRSLKEQGIKVAIHSNKYDAALQKLCGLHFKDLYDCALGEGTRSPKKPDPTGALTLMEMCGVKRENTVYIGDSEVDMETAVNAGIDSIWVSWGFRRAEEVGSDRITRSFDSAEELTRFISRQ